MLMEDKIESLRKRIKVRGQPHHRAAGTPKPFRSRTGTPNPSMTMQVTNGLAAFFIDENLKMREGQAIGTSDFLEAELESMRKRLEQKEQTLKEYRQRNMGELPEQLQANLNLLDRLERPARPEPAEPAHGPGQPGGVGVRGPGKAEQHLGVGCSPRARPPRAGNPRMR